MLQQDSYVCMHVRMVCTFVRTYVCICDMYIYMHICIRTCMNVRMDVCKHGSIHLHIQLLMVYA